MMTKRAIMTMAVVVAATTNSDQPLLLGQEVALDRPAGIYDVPSRACPQPPQPGTISHRDQQHRPGCPQPNETALTCSKNEGRRWRTNHKLISPAIASTNT